MLDQKTRPGLPPEPPETEREKIIIKESWYSRRKLRFLVLLVALLALLGAFGTAWYFSNTYRLSRFAERTVGIMQSASSYRGTGVEVRTEGGAVREIQERFDYVAPDSARTRYVTTVQGGGGPFGATVDCADREIVVVRSARYQRCSEGDAATTEWAVDTLGPEVFSSDLFQPWVRFLWCKKIHKEGQQEINGEMTKVFSCTVRNEQEANIIWEKKGKGLTDPAAKDARARFINEVSVTATFWVRESDGYFGRFAMTKTVPEKGGVVKQTVDYVYTEFAKLTSIEPPDTSAASSATTKAESAFRPQTAVVNGQTFGLEVANDDATRAKGLSKRITLPDDTAMLFVFSKEEVQAFWMKDTFIPLDILFLDRTRKIVDIQTMQTEIAVPDNRLRRYTSAAPALFALEMNAGLAKKLGLTTGMVVELR